MDSSSVLPDFSGIAIHDFWKPYFKYSNASHAVCNVHLLRELAGISENIPDQVWALEVIELLSDEKAKKLQSQDLIFS